MHGRTRTWIVAAATALVATLGASMVLSGPAAAEGDPALDNALNITPPAGWVLAPSSVSDAQVGQDEQIVGEITHVEFKVAVKEWTQPNSTNQLTAALLAYSSQEIGQIKNRVEGVKQVCGQGQTAVTATVAGIPGSTETSCSTPPPGGTKPGVATTYDFTDISWFTGDTYATVSAIGVPPAQVASDARTIAGAIPTGGFSVASGSSSDLFLLIGAGAAVVLGAVLFVLWRRRRAAGIAGAGPYQPFLPTASSWSPAPAYSAPGEASPAAATNTRQPTETTAPLPSFRPAPAAAPAVAPGWHPLPGDPTKTAYWDGTQWAAFRQWDGHQWVDAGALRH
jgi:hypothetical protein